jgi:hypothetical protein
MDKVKLSLALAIISGRVTQVEEWHYSLFGYNDYWRSDFVAPPLVEVKARAEKIILDALVDLDDAVNGEEEG